MEKNGYDLKVLMNEKVGGEMPAYLSRAEGEKVIRFHKTIESYRPTPLGALSELADKLNLRAIFVKDESRRFGLNAFKALGGTYAMARIICRELGLSAENMSFADLSSPAVREKIGQLTFVTATDGNHGRGVAWAAQQLGQKAVVFLPKGTARSRVDAIIETGNEAIVTDRNYDDTVRLAREKAEEKGWHLVQDSAWEGYTEVPGWVMQGYITLIWEALEQMREKNIDRPTHLFLQSGVGSMPAAILGYLVNIWGPEAVKTIIVEPHNAACIYNSAAHKDGMRHPVKGDLKTIMAGLACGEPNLIAWDILRDFSFAFISLEDFFAARGMRVLGSPLGSDPGIISGESGAVGIGLLSLLMEKPELAPVRNKLGLDDHSTVLILSTEGDTDPDHYRQIVWDGKYPLPFNRNLSYTLS